MKTFSEQLFQDYCAKAGFVCNRLPEEPYKTPDYEIVIEEQRIIVEVKEFDRNKDERESDQLLQQRGYGKVLSYTPGERVREKIRASSPQLKARTQGVYPGLLVLFDRGYGHADPYHIRTAMYGLEQVHLAVPRITDSEFKPYSTGMSYGPRRRMTEDDNTSISAIGVLATPGPNDMQLLVFHNKYAAIPLDRDLFARHRIIQYELADEVPGQAAQWKEVGSYRQPG